MGNWRPFSKKEPKEKQKSSATEENKTVIQEQSNITVPPKPPSSKVPDTKQGTLKTNHIQSNSHKGAQKNPKISQPVGRKDNAKTPAPPVQHTVNSNVARQQAEEERQRKKRLRQQIHKTLNDLYELGKKCEEGQILSFVQDFSSDIGLIREVFTRFQYGECETYPLSMIWLSLSDSPDDFLTAVRQRLEIHALVEHLTEQCNQFRKNLPTPVVYPVPTTEQGPQFATLTPEHIQSHIQALLEKEIPEFQVHGSFPFLSPGDYPVQLDFSHGITLPITLRLQVQPDVLPDDCVQDFKDVQPLLDLPATVDLLAFLQSYLVKASPHNLVLYGNGLRTVLVTVYHYGYGKTPWAQELIQEWRSKREEYQFKVGESEIQAVLQRIPHKRWALPSWLNIEPIDEHDLQEYIDSQLAQDPVLTRYGAKASWNENDEQTGFTVKIVWSGKLVGTIDLIPVDTLSVEEKEENRRLLQMFDQIFNKTAMASSIVGPSSRALQSFHGFVKTLRREVPISQWILSRPDHLPSGPLTLRDTSQKYQSDTERADAFLALTRAYGSQDNETFFRSALAQYCFWQGKCYASEAKRTRPYLQAFLFLYSQMSNDAQHAFYSDHYRAAAAYFSSYTFQVDVKESTDTEIANKFYTSLLPTLAGLNKGNYQALGNCLVGLAAVHHRLIFDLINRLKTRKDTKNQLQMITSALQEESVFQFETTACLHLLGRINVSTIAATLAQQTFVTADERRRIVHALLSVSTGANAPSPEALLRDFAIHATNERRFRLAYSLLAERFILGVPDKESALKARLVAEVLGLTSGKVGTEHFLGKATELAQLFDRFFSSQDPNVKGQFAITILETIHSARKQLMNDLPRSVENKAQREVLQNFFNRTQENVTTEQSKLIYDTTVVIALVNDRTLYSQQHARITIEIRKVDEGVAERLNLEVRPVEGKYQVEERYRRETIDVLDNKTPLQKDLYIQPLVNIDESIELDLVLRYDTLKTKAKKARLAADNRTVWFYPENEFVRVPQNYSTSAPATTWFYGRQEELQIMADHLRTGTEHDSSLIVYGLKRAGKTSVVQRFIDHTLKERELDKTHVPIYVNLLNYSRALRSDGYFLSFLIEIIYQELANERHLQLPFTLSQVQEQFGQDPFTAFSTYLGRILQAFRDQRLLLVLDEFSALYDPIVHPTADKALSSDLFSFLSNIIQSTHQLTFIFTGTYMLFDMMRNYMFDLAKICKPRMISFLDETSARQLIEEPVKRNPDGSTRGWLDYDDPRVVDRLVTYTRYHPYLIQCVCGLLVDRMNDLKYHRVNLNDLEAIVSEVITKPAHAMLMLNMWNDFERTQQRVLSVIADLTTPLQSWVDINEIDAIFKEFKETISLDEIGKICTSLTDAELLEKNTSTSDQSEAYCITIPLYQKWLKHNKSPRTVFGSRALPVTS